MIMNISEGVSYKKFEKNIPVRTSLTIKTSDWSSKTCTKTVPGMRSDMTVIASPSEESASVYYSSIVKATTQATDSLTFVCNTTPSSNLTVNIIMINSLAAGS